jgi:hypothetical protein
MIVGFWEKPSPVATRHSLPGEGNGRLSPLLGEGGPKGRERAWAALVFLALFSCFFAAPAFAQSPEDPPQVSLLTFAPGDVYWQRFAHNAILLRAADGRTAVFNYGIFDFRQKNFFLNFARGAMMYRLDVEPLDRTLRQYAEEGRWVYEQQLALSLDQRRQLTQYLVDNMRPENVEYRYDYFANNCSTRVRDALNQVLGGALQMQLEAQPTSVTYRSEVMRLMAPEPALMVGMDLGLGPSVDQPLNVWQQSFLPLTLMQAVRGVRVDDAADGSHPLVISEGYLSQPEASPASASTGPLLLPFAIAGIAIAALLLLLRSLRRFASARVLFALLSTAICLVAGLAGLVLAAAWAFTAHWGMWANQNLLLLNPLLLLLIPVWIGAARGGWYPGAFARRLMQLVTLLAVATLLLKGLPIARQDNLAWIALMLPSLLVMSGLLRAAHRSPPIWSR